MVRTSRRPFSATPIFTGWMKRVSRIALMPRLESPCIENDFRREAGAGSGKPDYYASVVLMKDRLYAVSRTGDTHVLAAKPLFEVLAHNQLASDQSDFNASPAISGGKILLRSNRFLYCIEGE